MAKEAVIKARCDQSLKDKLIALAKLSDLTESGYLRRLINDAHRHQKKL